MEKKEDIEGHEVDVVGGHDGLLHGDPQNPRIVHTGSWDHHQSQ